MKKINFAKLLSLLLCLCMIVAVFTLTSCNSDNNDSDATEEAGSEEVKTVEVVRAVKALKVGEKIGADALETVTLRAVDVPINAITDKAAVEGKYAVVDIYVGDIFVPAKIAAEIEQEGEIEAENDGIAYTLITKYASLVEGNDYTAAINKAIADHPNSTIYFPDGVYGISDTIVIPADPEKSVSLRLGGHTTIEALNWTDKTKPMIRIGVLGEGEDGEIIGTEDKDAKNVYIKGGVIDAKGVASGISLEGGEDILLANITIKDAYLGLHLKSVDNLLGATAADIENVHVEGTGEKGSIGVLVESTLNTLTNMQLSDVQYGLVCSESGADNIFRSIMAIGTGLDGVDNAGFWDKSVGNQYDICYSDQFATGFIIEENARSVYSGCQVSWWSADNDYHVGFHAKGAFNAMISYSKVIHDHTVSTDAYILVDAEGGKGFVYYPYDMTVSDQYSALLDQYCPTDILH